MTRCLGIIQHTMLNALDSTLIKGIVNTSVAFRIDQCRQRSRIMLDGLNGAVQLKFPKDNGQHCLCSTATAPPDFQDLATVVLHAWTAPTHGNTAFKDWPGIRPQRFCVSLPHLPLGS